MPVTFSLSSHPAEPVQPPYNPIQDPEGLLNATWGSTGKCKEFLQSTFSGEKTTTRDFSKIAPKDNGFVHTVVEAYNQHHHLVFRPDDVWIAILGQFNF